MSNRIVTAGEKMNSNMNNMNMKLVEKEAPNHAEKICRARTKDKGDRTEQFFWDRRKKQ